MAWRQAGSCWEAGLICLTWGLLLLDLILDVGNVGSGRVEVGSEQVELERLILVLGGLSVGTRSGRGLGLEEVLDLLHGLPWLGTLLSGGVVDVGLRLQDSLVEHRMARSISLTMLVEKLSLKL